MAHKCPKCIQPSWWCDECHEAAVQEAIAKEQERCIRVMKNAFVHPITMGADDQNTFCSTIVDYINRGDER